MILISLKMKLKYQIKSQLKRKKEKELINPGFKEKKHQNNDKILLTNIKSNYIIKKVFYNLDEKVKLKAIKYNNHLQKKIDINLTHYKFLSGKYIIYEEGKGKEYCGYSDKLLFEGEYLNGKRNGKGKEYDDYGNLEFEGEYLNGEKLDGKEKEYDDNGNLLFEGEYLNGIKFQNKYN